jgi:hypothetical protein
VAAGNLYDEARVRALPDGGEIVLGKRDLATPAALDLAFAKGIRVRQASDGSDGSDGASPLGSARPSAASGAGLWQRMLANDATYVVEVRAGRAVVHRLTPNGPIPIGPLQEG